MATILLLTIFTVSMTGALCCICFLIGAKVGQKVSKGEAVELPSVNPIRAIKERADRKQAEMEADKLETIMRNIERYDGTSKGQEDVG
jgi:hypothetical protein